MKSSLWIGGGVLAGLVVGLFGHFVLGVNSVRPLRRGAVAAEPGQRPGESWAAAAQAELQARRIEELRRKAAVAELEKADLERKLAATKAAATDREGKVRQLGRILARMMVLSKGGRVPAENGPELQKKLGEFMRLYRELGFDSANPSALSADPAVFAGLSEGILEEAGIPLDEEERRAWRAEVAARLSPIPADASALRSLLAVAAALGDFFDRFGERIRTVAPDMEEVLLQFRGESTFFASAISRRGAADLFVKDVARAAGLKGADAEALRPTVDAWAMEYAAILEEGRRKYGEEAVASVFAGTGMNVPRRPPAREFLQFRMQIIELQARTLEQLASQLTPEAAAAVLKLSRVYFYPKFTD
jgi:hypothetical protein